MERAIQAPREVSALVDMERQTRRLQADLEADEQE